ncbi:PREDICTED: trihelix transcription factor GT-2 isoform X2 [Tarenaya hassleriana]|uniref:trihelix transcription factor GT-2 isoform X2 n=1 Tax=Tarenaya hassleriana TaxID=28532 RepID=UPI00053C30BE|nr:PREDICTED: trihelix transcription factor GT-2 isoform X2 [Tarenaya hassleriana]
MLGDSGEALESSAASASAGEEGKDVKLEDSGEIVTGGGGGKRWPRPETLSLLRIRSEMDSSFRHSSLKAPLWEQISRRSAKKCKEKFENVYKYHKRTKENRSGKPEGKTYRFFDELEAFETLRSYPPEPESRPEKLSAPKIASLVPWISRSNPSSGTNASPLRNDPSNTTNPTFFVKKQSITPFVMNHSTETVLGAGYKADSNNFTTIVSSLNIFSSSMSSSTASEEEEEEKGKGSRKRRKYWKGSFKKLAKDLMEKQDEMQKRFFETLDKREEERLAKEEEWRVQETARINREYEILLHERSSSAVKDAAFISFLQKVSEQQHQQQKLPFACLNDQKHEKGTVEDTSKMSNGDSNYKLSQSSSRWPKAEIEALIRLRADIGFNYQDNGTKGRSLWGEISAGMRKIGYNRSAKRCKEKWENINKYFKKVRESSKKRPLSSKTCPYFHQLDAIYKEKNKTVGLPLMAATQQQMLPLQVTCDESEKQKTLTVATQQQSQVTFDESEKQEMGNEGDRIRMEETDSEEEEDEDNETGGFEMVLNRTCSPMDINNNVFA